jgi:hypothetical protein
LSWQFSVGMGEKCLWVLEIVTDVVMPRSGCIIHACRELGI